MDETDFLLQEALLLGASDLAGPTPKTDTQKLEDVMELIEKVISYRSAKKTVVRDENGFATSVIVEGHGAVKVITGTDGLIKSLGGLAPITRVE